ncbi:spore coat protein [Virgibacillus doumboii]|uniref:spore coat protein n=1 Tax=Virgibacillus doumboii TaxID=2697503 RepID=UPI0013DFC04F|nr:spore coat protein [Virgibacillus doumboii]
MGDDFSKQQVVPDKVVKLLIDDIFKKNNVKPEEVKQNITNEQRQMLKEMVEDLRKQVDQFNKGEKDINKTSE